MIVRSRLEVEVGVHEAVWSNITNLSVVWRLGLGLGGLNKKIIIFTNICKQMDQMPVALEN